MIPRHIEERLREALADTPVVLLVGARQTGKSTLARKLGAAISANYVTLDDATMLAAATADPTGFVRGLGDVTIIDEVQRAPGLFPALKATVDRDRRPGRFLLTGSANVLLLPRLAESLAGRMEILTLLPLSQGELRNQKEHFIDAALSSAFRPAMGTKAPEDDLPALIATGGFPEVTRRPSPRRRQAWFDSYITALLQRDVRDLAHIEGLTEMPRLLTLLSARVGGLLNMSELSRASGIAHTTLKRYLALLEMTYLVQPLPAWSTNLGKRLIKAAKTYLLDSGLAAHLTGHTPERMRHDPSLMGHLLENFVISELRKQATWSEAAVSLYHFRTTAGREVDFVLEDRSGRVAGIEVKAAAAVARKDFAGLEALAEISGKKFVRGIVLYGGDETVPFGERLHALPVSALWTT